MGPCRGLPVPASPTNPAPSDVVPDDLSLLGRITALAAAAGILGCGVLWIFEPDQIESGVMVVVGMVFATAVAIVSLALPWRRMSRAWVAFPVVAGAMLTALACWNTGGEGSPFAIFYLYIATLAAYFASRRQTLLAAGIVTACASLPVLYDRQASPTDRIFEWVLVSSMATALALVLQHQRERVRRATDHAHTLAVQDALTGVANRRGFEQRAAAELARARRYDLRFSVLYLDLDGFKRVNDVAGHAAGDKLLRRVALAIGVAVRGEDFVARHGGDEFAVLLPSAEEDEARRVAARIVAAVERTAADDPRLSGLSASVGGATYPGDGLTVTALLETADAELLRVKAERDFDARRASREYAIPAAPTTAGTDVFAGLTLDAGAADEAEFGWRIGGALAAIAALASIVVASWLLAPLTPDAELVRAAVTVGSLAALVVALAAAALRAQGRERVGWALVAVGAVVGWIPYLGMPSGLGLGLAILLLGAVAWPPSRRELLDLMDMVVVLSAFTVAYLVPPLADYAARHDMTAPRPYGTAVVATLGLACVLVVLTRTRPGNRPDLWLVAAGVGIAAGAAVPYAVSLDGGAAGLPEAGWQVLFPLAATLVAGGAVLRARNRTPVLPPGTHERDLPAVVVSNVLLGGLLVSVMFVRGSMPAAVIGCLVATLLVRHIRSRTIERENARLEEAAHRSEREVAAQYRASLVALGTALDARDGYTGGHGEATVRLARQVAERLELGESAVAEVEAVALLHDVGKIGMPDAILRKPGKLDEREWSIVREHPLIGERILRQVPGLERVARGVRHEHERWDGDGYPDGLEAESIPLASRITLVCDAYHAMTSDRPYREAMSHEEAARELRACAGTQFDPVVVRALLHSLGERPARDGAARPAHQAAS
jgi:diguanylate cyclase (GGDEF)-like protein